MNCTFRFLLRCALLVIAPLFAVSLHGAEQRLVRYLPENSLALYYVLDVPTLGKAWEHTPFAKMWADAEVQKFFAPGIKKMKEFEQEFISSAEMTPAEIFELFSGEGVVAVLDVNLDQQQKDAPPAKVIFAAEISAKPDRIAQIIEKIKKESGFAYSSEDFMGETIHVFTEQKEGELTTNVLLIAHVDGVLLLSVDEHTSIHAFISNLKAGAAKQSLGESAAFVRALSHLPGTQDLLYLNVREVGAKFLAKLREEQTKNPAGNPMGVTPDDVFRGLGIDAIDSIHIAGAISEAASEIEFGIAYSEFRGVVTLLAYEKNPPPRPDFISTDWDVVTTARFSFPETYAALKNIVGEISPPMLGMAMGQIQVFNRKLSIDLERDLIGSIGDEVISLANFRKTDDPKESIQANQLIAVSLTNADAFMQSTEALKLMMGPASQFFSKREYLGVTIHEFAPPYTAPRRDAKDADEPENVPVSEPPVRKVAFAYAITPTHFLLSIGSAGSIDLVLQTAKAPGNSIWNNREVVQRLEQLPPGAVEISYGDLKKMIPTYAEIFFDGFKSGFNRVRGKSHAQEDNRNIFWDQDASLPVEAIASYCSWMIGGSYAEKDGLYRRIILNHTK